MPRASGDRAGAMSIAGQVGPAPVVLAGIGLLSVMDAIVKLISADVPVWQIVLLRYAFGTAFALPLLVGGRRPSAEALRAHLARAAAIVLTAATFFYALAHLPLAVALALSFTAPILIAFLARLGLGERPGTGVKLAIGLGFAGVLLVLLGELGRSGTATLPGIAAAMAAAAFYAATMVSLRARAARDPLGTVANMGVRQRATAPPSSGRRRCIRRCGWRGQRERPARTSASAATCSCGD